MNIQEENPALYFRVQSEREQTLVTGLYKYTYTYICYYFKPEVSYKAEFYSDTLISLHLVHSDALPLIIEVYTIQL